MAHGEWGIHVTPGPQAGAMRGAASKRTRSRFWGQLFGCAERLFADLITGPSLEKRYGWFSYSLLLGFATLFTVVAGRNGAGVDTGRVKGGSQAGAFSYKKARNHIRPPRGTTGLLVVFIRRERIPDT